MKKIEYIEWTKIKKKNIYNKLKWNNIKYIYWTKIKKNIYDELKLNKIEYT